MHHHQQSRQRGRRGGRLRSRSAAFAVGALLAAALTTASLGVRAGDTDERYRLLQSMPGAMAPARPVFSPSWGVGHDEPVPEQPRPKPRRALRGDSLGGTQTYCVRTCDGFYFPIGHLRSTADEGAHAEACRASCPGAETRLYTARGTDIEHALGPDRLPYSALPAAFAFRSTRDAACGCGRRAKNNYVEITQDRTLRAGDSVMVGGRLLVFKGARHWPLQPTDFAEVGRDGGALTKAERRTLSSLVAAGGGE